MDSLHVLFQAVWTNSQQGVQIGIACEQALLIGG